MLLVCCIVVSACVGEVKLEHTRQNKNDTKNSISFLLAFVD